MLRYRLLPLLAGRVQVDRMSLDKPVLVLAMDAKGGFNYEKLGRGAAKGAPATPGTAAPAAAPLRIVMKSLAVENGSVRMEDQAKARLMAIEGIDFRSGFEVAGGLAQGNGPGHDREGQRRRRASSCAGSRRRSRCRRSG